MKLLESKRILTILIFIAITLSVSIIISMVEAQLTPLSLNEPVSVTDSLSLNLNGATITPVPPDTEKPTISISSPSSGESLTTDTITISGTASDNVGLSKVEVEVNSGSWQLASGTASWNKQVTLSLGTNTIYARATDTSGYTAITSVTIDVLPPPTPTPPPSPITGNISVSSNPSGASIYLDGDYQGTAPKTLTSIAAGSHDINLKLTGYKDWSQTINVVAGQTFDVSAPLTPTSPPDSRTPAPTPWSTPKSTAGSISVLSYPSGASVYLDGSYKGAAPKTITGVAEGPHTITLKLTDYQDWSQSINVIAARTVDVSADLIPVPLPIPEFSFHPIIFIFFSLAIGTLIFIIYRKRKTPMKEYHAKMEKWEKEGYDITELKEVIGREK